MSAYFGMAGRVCAVVGLLALLTLSAQSCHSRLELNREHPVFALVAGQGSAKLFATQR